jgi:hypothetical protein
VKTLRSPAKLRRGLAVVLAALSLSVLASGPVAQAHDTDHCAHFVAIVNGRWTTVFVNHFWYGPFHYNNYNHYFDGPFQHSELNVCN